MANNWPETFSGFRFKVIYGWGFGYVLKVVLIEFILGY